MIGIIVGTLSALIVTLLVVAVIVIILIRHKRSKQNNNRHCLKPVERHIAMNMNSIRNIQNGKVSNGNMYNSVAQEDLESDRELCNGGDKLCKSPSYCEPQDSLVSGGRDLPDLPGCATGSAGILAMACLHSLCTPLAVYSWDLGLLLVLLNDIFS
jgi:hypothetical protein